MKKPKSKSTLEKNIEVVTLGGGCFWCLEAVFDEIKGVENVESGYSGGITTSPDYKQVCSGTTGHAEVVQISFDPRIISFRKILEIFFTIHDPTTLNRQGADIGSQYRSIILYHNKKQKNIAKQVIKELEAAKIWDNPITTQIEPFNEFYKAEEYHDRYYYRNLEASYCKIVIAPKIAKFRKKYSKKLRKM